MIEVKDLSFSYDLKPVISDIAFELQAGEMLAVMGPNGMGKSTLLGLLGGVLPMQRGSIAIHGYRRRSSLEAEEEIRKQVYYLPYDGWLPPGICAENILFSVGKLYGHTTERLAEHIDLLLTLFNLSDKRGVAPEALSTGQYKKLLLCAAFISEAAYLILDEPFSGGLDPAAILALQELFLHLREKEKRTVIIASPVPELHANLAHKVALIDNGRLSFYGSPQELMVETQQQTFEEAVRHMSSPKQQAIIESYKAAF